VTSHGERPPAQDPPLEQAGSAGSTGSAGERPAPRPLVERLGIALIALVIAALFGAMGLAAWLGSEVFLAAMAWLGALMTLWAAGSTIVRR
jgi:hypothetical protein